MRTIPPGLLLDLRPDYYSLIIIPLWLLLDLRPDCYSLIIIPPWLLLDHFSLVNIRPEARLFLLGYTQAIFFPSVFMLYVALKRGFPRKCTRFVKFCPVKKRSL